ncbi:hypothetical protein [Mesorhizobium sp. WSM2561]|uniref:hypothetical protein n=1 Tax=Mesorhizobium sp. WSM2561 TaxID=1040985 RepID=UPI0012EB18F1|nr:hypothetical protein [Mesorhizobium sp. WSM2561]
MTKAINSTKTREMTVENDEMASRVVSGEKVFTLINRNFNALTANAWRKISPPTGRLVQSDCKFRSAHSTLIRNNVGAARVTRNRNIKLSITAVLIIAALLLWSVGDRYTYNKMCAPHTECAANIDGLLRALDGATAPQSPSHIIPTRPSTPDDINEMPQ